MNSLNEWRKANNYSPVYKPPTDTVPDQSSPYGQTAQPQSTGLSELDKWREAHGYAPTSGGSATPPTGHQAASQPQQSTGLSELDKWRAARGYAPTSSRPPRTPEQKSADTLNGASRTWLHQAIDQPGMPLSAQLGQRRQQLDSMHRSGQITDEYYQNALKNLETDRYYGNVTGGMVGSYAANPEQNRQVAVGALQQAQQDYIYRLREQNQKATAARGRDLEANAAQYIANYDQKINELTTKKDLLERQLHNKLHSSANIDAEGVGGERDEIKAIEQQIEQLKAAKWRLEREAQYDYLYLKPGFNANSVNKKTEEGKLATLAEQTYDYINDIGDFRSKVETQAYYGGLSGSQQSEHFRKYKQMTDREIATYNYLYNTEGLKSAAEYLDYLSYELDARLMGEKKENAAEFANQNPFLASTLSIPMKLTSGVGLIDVAAQNARRGITGEYRPINYNTSRMDNAVISSGIREARAEYKNSKGVINLDENKYPVLSRILNGKGWGDVYQLRMSMLDSAANAALMGTLGLTSFGTVLLGGAAATQGMLDAIERGADDRQALTMGVLNGAFEMLFEKLSFDNIIKGDPAKVGKFIAAQMFTEGSEELFTTVANDIADAIVMAEKSNWQANINRYIEMGYSPEEARNRAFWDAVIAAGWDFVGGALSGGIMGGGRVGLSHMFGGSTAGSAQSADDLSQPPPSRRPASPAAPQQGVQQQPGQMPPVQAPQTQMPQAQAQSQMQQPAQGQRHSGQFSTITEAGKSWEKFKSENSYLVGDGLYDINDLFDDWLEAHPGTYLTLEEVEGPVYTPSQDTAFDEELPFEFEEPAHEAQTQQQDTRTIGYDTDAHILSSKDAKRSWEQYISEKYHFVEDGTVTEEQLFNSWLADDFNRPLTFDEAKQVTQQYLQANRPAQAQQPLQQPAAQEATQQPVQAQEVVREIITPPTQQNAGNEPSGELNSSPAEQVQNKAETQKQKPPRKKRGRVSYGGAEHLFEWAKPSHKNKVSSEDYNVIRCIAQVTGVNFVFYESQRDADGNLIGENGFYHNGTVYLDVNAGIDKSHTEKALLVTVAHELTHHIQQNASSEYTILENFIKDRLNGEGYDFDDMVSSRMEKYGESYEKACGEVIANACETVLKDSEAVAELASTGPKLYKKIVDWLHNFYSNLLKAIGSIESRHAESRLLQQYMDVLVVLWDNGLVAATKNQAESVNASDTAMSVREDITQDGVSYGKGVYLDTDLFDGVKPRHWGKVLHNYIYNNLAGSNLVMFDENGNKEVVRIARTSDRVQKDGANNSHRVIDKLARQTGDNNKALATAHVDELLYVSRYDSSNIEHSHQWLDENGWEHRTAIMQNKNGDVFEVTLNIGNSRDGKVLYDINKIRPVTGGAVPSAQKGGARSTSHDKSAHKVAQDAEIVKGENELFSEADTPILFSMRDEVEYTDKFVAIHNRSESGYRRMLEEGGITGASIAVKKAGSGHASFGEYSVVLFRDSFDPELHQNDRLYGGDAWTPVGPNPYLKPVDLGKAKQSIEDSVGSDIFELFNGDTEFDEYSVERAINNAGGDVFEAFRSNRIVRAGYLQATGRMPKFDYTDANLSPIDDNYRRPVLPNDILIYIFEHLPKKPAGGKYDLKTIERLYNRAAGYKLSSPLSLSEQERKAIIKAHKKWLSAGKQVPKVRDFSQNVGALYDLICDDSIYSEPEYKSYVENLLSCLIFRKYISTNQFARDFTEQYNHGELEPYTPDNVLKHILSKPDFGADRYGNYVPSGAAVKRYHRISEARSDSERLLSERSAAYKDAKEVISDRIHDIYYNIFPENAIPPSTIGRYIHDANSPDELERMIFGNASFDYYESSLLSYEESVEKLVDDLWQWRTDAANMPAPYFEAKAMHFIPTKEMAFHVIPDNAPSDIVDILDSEGLRYVFYEAGNDDSRRNQLNSAPEVFFNRRDDDGDYNELFEMRKPPKRRANSAKTEQHKAQPTREKNSYDTAYNTPRVQDRPAIDSSIAYEVAEKRKAEEAEFARQLEEAKDTSKYSDEEAFRLATDDLHEEVQKSAIAAFDKIDENGLHLDEHFEKIKDAVNAARLKGERHRFSAAEKAIIRTQTKVRGVVDGLSQVANGRKSFGDWVESYKALAEDESDTMTSYYYDERVAEALDIALEEYKKLTDNGEGASTVRYSQAMRFALDMYSQRTVRKSDGLFFRQQLMSAIRQTFTDKRKRGVMDWFSKTTAGNFTIRDSTMFKLFGGFDKAGRGAAFTMADTIKRAHAKKTTTRQTAINAMKALFDTDGFEKFAEGETRCEVTIPGYNEDTKTLSESLALNLLLTLDTNNGMEHASRFIMLPSTEAEAFSGKNGGGFGDGGNGGVVIKLSDEELSALKANLSEAVNKSPIMKTAFGCARAVVEFLGVGMNKVSQMVDGVDRATQGRNYWHLVTASDPSKDITHRGGKRGIDESSYVQKRSNPTGSGDISGGIKIVPFMDAVNQLINTESDYVAYAGLIDILDTLNTPYTDNTFEDMRSIEGTLRDFAGEKYRDWFENWLLDLRGLRGQKQDVFSKVAAKFRSNVASAALRVNIGTWAKQMADYWNFGSVVDFDILWRNWKPGAFVGNLFGIDGYKSNELVQNVSKYTSMLDSRASGYTTVEMGEFVSGGRDGGLVPKNLGNWLNKAEHSTSANGICVVAEQVHRDFPDLDVKSEEFYRLVAARYEQAAVTAQPVYDRAARPELLRTPNELVRNLSMFMTQPLQEANNLMEAVLEYKAAKEYGNPDITAEAKKRLSSTLKGQFIGKAIFGLIGTLGGLARRKRDYKDDETGEFDWGRLGLDFGLNVVNAYLGMIWMADELFGGAVDIAENLLGDDKGGTHFFGIEGGAEGLLNDAISATIDLSAKQSLSSFTKAAISIATLCGSPVRQVYNYVSAAYMWSLDAGGNNPRDYDDVAKYLGNLASMDDVERASYDVDWAVSVLNKKNDRDKATALLASYSDELGSALSEIVLSDAYKSLPKDKQKDVVGKVKEYAGNLTKIRNGEIKEDELDRWMTELSGKEQGRYLLASTFASTCFDKDNKYAPAYENIDSFLGKWDSMYGKLSDDAKAILNENSRYSRFDDMHEAAKYHISSEDFYKAYGLYNQYKDMDGGSTDRAEDLKTAIMHLPNLSDTQKAFLADTLKLTNTYYVDTDRYDELVESANLSHDSANAMMDVFGALEPFGEHEGITHAQEYRAIGEAEFLTNDEKWAVFYATATEAAIRDSNQWKVMNSDYDYFVRMSEKCILKDN